MNLHDYDLWKFTTALRKSILLKELFSTLSYNIDIQGQAEKPAYLKVEHRSDGCFEEDDGRHSRKRRSQSLIQLELISVMKQTNVQRRILVTVAKPLPRNAYPFQYCALQPWSWSAVDCFMSKEIQGNWWYVKKETSANSKNTAK